MAERPDEIADSLAENWINGNRELVIKTLSEERLPLETVLIVLGLSQRLAGNDLYKLIRLTQNRLEQHG